MATLGNMVVGMEVAIAKDRTGNRVVCITPRTLGGESMELLFTKDGLSQLIDDLIQVRGHFDDKMKDKDEDEEEDPQMEIKRRISEAFGIPVESIGSVGFIDDPEEPEEDKSAYVINDKEEDGLYALLQELARRHH